MSRVLDLCRLCEQPESARDQEWEKAFLQALRDGHLNVEASAPQAGPDGWPYLHVRTHPQATEPARRVLEWLATQGVGLVLNAHKMLPDYTLTFGMIWNFIETNEFLISGESATPAGHVLFQEGERVLAGPPSKQYLPPYVRAILSEFFERQGVPDPRVLVMSQDKKQFDLCFSLNSLGQPDESEHRGIAEALSWFLPLHYTVMLVGEEGLPKFHSLKSI